MWTLSVGRGLGSVGVGCPPPPTTPQPTAKRRVTRAIDTLTPYFKGAESISGLGLAQNKGFVLVLA